MRFFYTKVPTQWSLSELYMLKDGVFLKPATRTAYNDYPNNGSIMYFDTMFFITSDETKDEHIANLRKWLLYHDFIFNFDICHFFESGLLQEHNQANTIEEIQEEGDKNDYICNYDTLSKEIYFMHTPPTTWSYRNLFLRYEELPENKKSLITAFLLTMDTTRQYLKTYSLFHNARKHWQVASNVAVLEAIIGHSANCILSEVRACCVGCKKELQPHRAGSEKQWRDQYLSLLPLNQEIKEQYFTIINAAYDEIRHKTTHFSSVPNPQYPTIVGTQVYDINRSIKNVSNDVHALDSLGVNIREVTRYILLNYIFDLKYFPPIEAMKVTRIEL